jgi:DNA-binding transcriptional MerR regulator
MSDDRTNKRIPMRELEKLTELSRATINFYIREGILPMPLKSAKNMAYYDHDFIRRLDRIKKLKKAGFSLGQIRQFMNAEQELDNEFVMEVIGNINRLMPNETENQTVTLDRIRSIGFDDDSLRDLLKMNLIIPIDAEGQVFPAYNLTICEFVKYFLDYGLPMSVAKVVVQKMVELTEIENEAYMTYIRKPLMEKGATLNEQLQAVQECIEKINALLPLIHLQLLKTPAENRLKHSS